MAEPISAAQKARLKRDGWVLLPRAVPPAVFEPALREINNRLGTGRHPERDLDADPRDYLSEYVSSPAVMALARGRLREAAEALLGPGRVEPLSQGQVVLRFPAASADARYDRLTHIDGLYASKDGLYAGAGKPLRYSLCAGVLLSDTPAPDMGNLLVYPGSHRLIARAVAKRGLDALKHGLDGLGLPKAAQVTGRAGDAVLFHFQLAHDKAPNYSPHIRSAAYFRFWHLGAWHDRSREYLEKAMIDPWLEWPGMRGVRAA